MSTVSLRTFPSNEHLAYCHGIMDADRLARILSQERHTRVIADFGTGHNVYEHGRWIHGADGWTSQAFPHHRLLPEGELHGIPVFKVTFDR